MSFKEEARFLSTVAEFDALNAQDPNTVKVSGEEQPKELHDAWAMTRWIEAIYPEASEAVHLAARCQHLCRWEIPRSDYPEGRAAYHKWRTDLKKFHAEKSASVMRDNGYDEAMVESVQAINLKQNLRSNLEVQQIEDALCLVFLECQFEDYLDKWDEEKIIRILQKTWVKMSATGQKSALGLELSERARGLIERALSSAD